MEQEWRDPSVAAQWDAQGLESNPVRTEQLAILVRLLTDIAPESSCILDVGFGSGQIEARLFSARPDWHVIGVDYSTAMMESLWPAYQSLWQRLDDIHGSKVGMHEGHSPSEHATALARRGDRPATVAQHLEWLTTSGFRADVIHAHAQRTLIAARKDS